MNLQWLPVVFKITLWLLFTSPPLSLPIASTLRALKFLRVQQKHHLLISFWAFAKAVPSAWNSHYFTRLTLPHPSGLNSPSFLLLEVQAVSVTSSGLFHPLGFPHPRLDDSAWASSTIALSALRYHYLVTSPSPPVTFQDQSLGLSTPVPQRCPA